ncbi:NAD-dependent epimerase/dehydratase family protein [Staphylococcus pasteuri]|uniref:polysaccharide biosynthesis C-terminal domain-containing protein n=1 Tax=Staphylococcus pasteuri TaxID=45972 RepID=UPI000E392662|nr:NAD-dependent epimerase/dehydratase family protein [Staphylococcus pasteuri]RFD73815.1 capsular biosynthesis protein [Staphylococcus pasteuri]
MNIVVTGAKGFIGRNLCIELRNYSQYQVYEISRETNSKLVEQYLLNADIILHLAALNRFNSTKDISDTQRQDIFNKCNVNQLSDWLQIVSKNKKRPSIIFTSSIQAELDNHYGRSKLQAELLLQQFKQVHGNEVIIYRLPNLFGKWCKPNYNSVVATFCYNIARNKPIHVTDSTKELKLNYIDDVIRELIRTINGHPTKQAEFAIVPNVHRKTLGQIEQLLRRFKKMRETLSLPYLEDPFEKALYSTYLSYLPDNAFGYPLHMHKDDRGSFTEIFKTSDQGQISVNVSKPGIVKGNHWHHTKNEKFLVVAGKGIIRFRLPDSKQIIEYVVSSDKLEIIDIPVGYTHNIENLGEEDMVTLMWANEIFDAEHPDTYFLEV